MATPIRFHLDENMPNGIAAGLRTRQRDVTTTSEAGLLGASDEQQLSYAHATRRVIVTRDADLLVLNSQGFPHCGIVYWTEKRSLGQLAPTSTR
jgi:predicted nuclease of predicted toxin-antitoxin system